MTCTQFTVPRWSGTVVSLEEYRALVNGKPLQIRLWREAMALMEQHRHACVAVAQGRVDAARLRRDFPDYCEAVQTLRIVVAIMAAAAAENR